MHIQLLHGDCLQKLKDLPDNSVSSVVCDPPYGLSFMSKKWDYDVPSTEIWMECLRVLKPGGHLLAFAGSRTYHRMAVRIEDAGFEIRDQIMWLYASGFPKSHNIGKAVDKLLGNEREVVGERIADDITGGNFVTSKPDKMIEITKGQTEWEGWGTALKPAHEPIVVARKPLSEKSVAENVLKWGTGGINIDASRVGTTDNTARINKEGDNGWKNSSGGLNTNAIRLEEGLEQLGRWPANIILDEEAGKVLDEQSGISKGKIGMTKQSSPNNIYNGFKSKGNTKINDGITDEGGASRYFLSIKVDNEDFFMYIYNTLNELLCGNILENQQVVTTLNGVIKEVEKCIVNQGQYIIGNKLMDQYQKDTISIISTLTELMTELKIYNSLQRVNIDFYTQELGKTINQLTELNIDGASVAKSINHLMGLTLEMVEHIKVIVKNVEELNYKNGGKEIGNTTTNITGNIEKGNRFFYCAKASKKDRDEGLDIFEDKERYTTIGQRDGTSYRENGTQIFPSIVKNNHPTVKPTSLMEYLIKLVTPVGATVLDPFMGSGSTGKAAVRNGFDFIGIEREEEYLNIAKARIENANNN